MMKISMQRSTVVSRRSLVVRATNGAPPPPPPTPASGTPVVPAAVPVAAAPIPVVIATPVVKTISIGDAMAFSGPAPEKINGRLAMLGFVAALGAEINSEESILNQFSDAALPVIAAFAVFSIASFIPILKGANPEERFGPFTPAAETLNGRVAMIGFFGLLVLELTSGKALL